MGRLGEPGYFCIFLDREMNIKPWTLEEIKILRSMRIDPIKSDREKLIELVNHFKKGGGTWAVSDGGVGSVTVSRKLARKVRDLVSNHALDWLLSGELKSIGAPEGEIAQLCILTPSVDIWSDGISTARYATISVSLVNGTEVKDCWAWVEVLPNGYSFPLYWLGTPITSEETSAPRLIINSKKEARLVVAFTLPPHGKAAGYSTNANVSGEVPMYVPSSRLEEHIWNGEGCWLAQPLALYNPNPKLEAFLSPGEYKIIVRVGCDKCEGDDREFILLSPTSWEELGLLVSV